MSGRFPDSDDVLEYKENLLNKVDMVSCDNRRWEPTHPEIPQRTGKVNKVTKFDAGFFGKINQQTIPLSEFMLLGLHYRQNHTTDPMNRMLMEHTIEALFDAGVHPDELENTRTGVFIGTCSSESEKTWFYDRHFAKHFAVTG